MFDLCLQTKEKKITKPLHFSQNHLNSHETQPKYQAALNKSTTTRF